MNEKIKKSLIKIANEIIHFDITKFEIDSISKEPNLARQLQKLRSYKTIIIAKPQLAFNNLDKLLIDQYIITGGNLFFLIDYYLYNYAPAKMYLNPFRRS